MSLKKKFFSGWDHPLWVTTRHFCLTVNFSISKLQISNFSRSREVAQLQKRIFFLKSPASKFSLKYHFYRGMTNIWPIIIILRSLIEFSKIQKKGIFDTTYPPVVIYVFRYVGFFWFVRFLCNIHVLSEMYFFRNENILFQITSIMFP